MGFNRYVFNIITRSILLALNALAIALFAIKMNWVFTFIFLLVIFILQIYLLIKYSTKTNRDLANFLIHLREQDTSIAFSQNSLDKTFSGLTKEFENISAKFEKIKNDRIRNQNFLNLMLDQVGTGILVMNSQNEINLFNRAMLRILGIDDKAGKNQLRENLQLSLHEFKQLQAGEQKIATVHVNNITRRILIALSEIKEDHELLKVYSFHDIDREMTDYELQSWNGLIRVLSHEIMNTLTPVSTVIDTLKDCLTIEGQEKNVNQLIEKDISDSLKSTKLIENRINSLKNFIIKFRQFSDIPNPVLIPLNVKSLLQNFLAIYKTNKSTILFELEPISESLSIKADKELIELVLNNIIKNAIEALSQQENPRISIKAYHFNTYIAVDICDNGTGIEPSIIRKVFLPFYTTKKEGSGIGLSLARQIMFSHQGNIEIESDTNGTCVRLLFNEVSKI